MLLIGRFQVTVDGKGRVCVPAQFRDALKSPAHLFVYPSQHLQCVEGAGQQVMDDRAAQIAALDPFDLRRAALDRIFFGEAQQVAVDSTGRFVLPEPFRSLTGIANDAVFVGARDHFQLWSPDREADWATQARHVARS